jgi:hypothetical protein
MTTPPSWSPGDAGALADWGVRFSGAGTKSTIDLDQTLRLRDLVTPVWFS